MTQATCSSQVQTGQLQQRAKFEAQSPYFIRNDGKFCKICLYIEINKALQIAQMLQLKLWLTERFLQYCFYPNIIF